MLRANKNDSSYCTSDGQLMVQDTFTPKYKKEIYEDFVLFIPYDEFYAIYQTGEHWMKFNVVIQYEQERIAETYYYEFYFEF
jgi:hypothetical protein